MRVSRYCSLSKSAALICAVCCGACCAASPALARSSRQDPAETARLLVPRPAFRLLEDASATLDYVLNAPPDNPIIIEVHDSAGALVATLHPDALQPGLNRIEWDLRWSPPLAVALRTTPPENPHIWEEPRFQGAQTRPVAHKGIEQAQLGPLAAPGRYTVELHVDGKTYTQPLDVLLPPSSHGSEADIQASVRLQLRLRDDIDSVAAMTNRVEWLRKQLEDQRKRSAPPALDAMDRKLQNVEFQLISHSDALSDEKYDAEAARLYLNFLWLNLSLGTGAGKYAGGADYAPTDTAMALARDLETQLRGVEAEYRKLMDDDVPAYNRAAPALGLPPLVVEGKLVGKFFEDGQVVIPRQLCKRSLHNSFIGHKFLVDGYGGANLRRLNLALQTGQEILVGNDIRHERNAYAPGNDGTNGLYAS
jgi:hypothetical protein